jgi:hypothetical protein
VNRVTQQMERNVISFRSLILGHLVSEFVYEADRCNFSDRNCVGQLGQEPENKSDLKMNLSAR